MGPGSCKGWNMLPPELRNTQWSEHRWGGGSWTLPPGPHLHICFCPSSKFLPQLGENSSACDTFKIVQCRVRDPQFRMCGNLNQVKGRGNCPRVGARSTIQTQPNQSSDGVGVWCEEAQACSRMAALLFGGWKSGHQNMALAALPQTFLCPFLHQPHCSWHPHMSAARSR